MAKNVRGIARLCLSLIALAIISMTWARILRAQEQPDFLSPNEANQVRDEQDPGERAKLFLNFAHDRLKKFEYELQLKSPQMHREELLNGLLDGYSSCLDEGTERLRNARKAGANLRNVISAFQKESKQNLEMLKKIEAAGGPKLDSYKDNLDDAIGSTQDALDEANKAAKEYGSVPIRRKP
ncbi:MAG TPA: hypothetical protein VGR81_07300 [Candidatus Acidoferrales bacterium]|nr:hypothetical protein [Candidatus Acidoferrales bacterium]